MSFLTPLHTIDREGKTVPPVSLVDRGERPDNALRRLASPHPSHPTNHRDADETSAPRTAETKPRGRGRGDTSRACRDTHANTTYGRHARDEDIAEARGPGEKRPQHRVWKALSRPLKRTPPTEFLQKPFTRLFCFSLSRSANMVDRPDRTSP